MKYKDININIDKLRELLNDVDNVESWGFTVLANEIKQDFYSNGKDENSEYELVYFSNGVKNIRLLRLSVFCGFVETDCINCEEE